MRNRGRLTRGSRGPGPVPRGACAPGTPLWQKRTLLPRLNDRASGLRVEQPSRLSSRESLAWDFVDEDCVADVKVLATSREALGLTGEVAWRVCPGRGCLARARVDTAEPRTIRVWQTRRGAQHIGCAHSSITQHDGVEVRPTKRWELRMERSSALWQPCAGARSWPSGHSGPPTTCCVPRRPRRGVENLRLSQVG